MSATKFDAIPPELKALPQWVLWKSEEREGKATKVPCTPWGSKADSTDRSTWSAFKTATDAYKKGGFDGIGFVLRPPYVGVDLDTCILADGTIKPQAEDVVRRLASYAERSPSGKGIHVIARGSIPSGRKKGDFEMYQIGRYFTMTGDHFSGTPTTIEDRPEEITAIYRAIFGDNGEEASPSPAAVATTTPALSDDQIIALAAQAYNSDKFLKLMAGDTSGYPSESEADMALASILAFYTRDQGQICRILQRSKLWDEKWERPDYQDRTIGGALELVTEPYSGNSLQESGEGEENELLVISEDDLLKIKIPENPRFKTVLESDNFIQEYIRYGETVTDSYPDYWFAGGLFCLSVAVNRNAVIKLRQGPVYPNVWINLLGLSSLSRKSTCIDKADLTIAAANIDPDCKMPDEFSPEAMIERLDQHPRGYMLKDESAGLLAVMKKDYMRGLKDALMQLYDGKDINRELRTSRRKSDKTKFQVKDPYLCLMLATTPGSFAANTELLDVTSGWLPRFLHFFPNHVKDRWLPLEEGVPANDRLSAKCQARLIKIRQAFYDRPEPLVMHLAKGADAYFKAWQKARESELVEAKDDRRAQFYSRLAVYVLKMGMLFTIGRAAYKEGMEISLDHTKEACRLVDEYFMPMAMTVADLVGKAADKNNLDKVIAILTSQGGKIKKRELGRKSHLRAKDLDETLESLRDFGEIEIVTVSNRRGEPSVWIVLSQDNGNRDTVSSVTTVIPVIPSHQNECEKDDEDINTVTRCDSNDGSASMTVCDGKNDHPFSDDYLNEVLVCRRIKKAIADGITDPIALSQFCGLPVCLVAKFPGANSIAAAGIRGKLEAHRREQHFREKAEQHKTNVPKRFGLIYQPKGAALEYSAWGLNLVESPKPGGAAEKTCSNGCVYCYNRHGKKDYDSLPGPTLKPNLLEKLNRDLPQVKAHLKPGERVHLTFVGDLYDREVPREISRKVLELFKEHQVPFQVLTKNPDSGLGDLDLYFDGCRFGTTLTFDNDEDSRRWEPNASLPAARIDSLKTAHSRGIFTWVSLEPVIESAQSLNLLAATLDFVDFRGVGKLNHDLPRENSINLAKFRAEAEAMLKNYHKDYMIKEALRRATEEPQAAARKDEGVLAVLGPEGA